MQTPNNPIGSPAKLNITTADVLGVLNRIIEVEGLEAARVAFKQMNEFFSGMWGWVETTNAVYALFAAVRRKEHKEQFEEQLAAELDKVQSVNTRIQKLSWQEELALANIDCMKEEVVNMVRKKRESGRDSFELTPEKARILHDDRALNACARAA